MIQRIKMQQDNLNKTMEGKSKMREFINKTNK